jgi:tetratricopeptide (TPR) repeat protein
LGRLYLDLGEYEEAIRRFRAAAAVQRQSGANRAAVMETRLFEGYALGMLGDPDAEAVIRGAVEDRLEVYGHLHRQTLMARVGLAAFYIDQGRTAEAMTLLPDIIAGVENLPAGQIKELMQAARDFQFGMGLLLVSRQRGGFILTQAENSFRKSLATVEPQLPPDHIYLTLARFQLAYVLDLQGKDREADQLFEQSLDSMRRTTGLAHPKVLTMIELIADRAGRAKQVVKARTLFDEVERANRERFGPDSHWMTVLQLRQAEFEAEHGDEKRTTHHAREALRLVQAGKLSRSRVAVVALFDTAKAVGDRRGNALRALASELFAIARGHVEKLYGGESREMAIYLNKYGYHLFGAGEHAEGYSILKRAEEMAGRLPKPIDDTEHNLLLYHLGQVELASGNADVAERYYRRALDLSRRFADSRDDREIDATGLAGALVDQRKYGEAVKSLAEVDQWVKRRADAAELDKAKAAGLLAEVYLAAGDHNAYRSAVTDLLRRFGRSEKVDPLTAAARAVGLDPGTDPTQACDLRDRLAATLKKHPKFRAGHRALALLQVRAGTPGDAVGVIARVGGSTGPLDHLILGLAAARAGDQAKARFELYRASAARPRPDRPFPYAGGYWLDRLEEAALTAELERLLPPGPPPELAAPPRRGE